MANTPKDQPRGASTDRIDLALSFAGEDRNFVRSVAERLRSREKMVFFDETYELHLWGHDKGGLRYYFTQAPQFVVAFISRFYLEKPWCEFELTAAMGEENRRGRPFVLPVSLDGRMPPAFPDKMFLDAWERTATNVTDWILDKTGGGYMVFEPEGQSSSASQRVDEFLEDESYAKAGLFITKRIDGKGWHDWGTAMIQRRHEVDDGKVEEQIGHVRREFVNRCDSFIEALGKRHYFSTLGRLEILLSNLMAFEHADYAGAENLCDSAHQRYVAAGEKHRFDALLAQFEHGYVALQRLLNGLWTLKKLKTAQDPLKMFDRGTRSLQGLRVWEETQGGILRLESRLTDFDDTQQDVGVETMTYAFDYQRQIKRWQDLRRELRTLREEEEAALGEVPQAQRHLKKGVIADIQMREAASQLFEDILQSAQFAGHIYSEIQQPGGKKGIENSVRGFRKTGEGVNRDIYEAFKPRIIDEWWFSEIALSLWTVHEWSKTFVEKTVFDELDGLTKGYYKPILEDSVMFSRLSRGMTLDELRNKRGSLKLF